MQGTASTLDFNEVAFEKKALYVDPFTGEVTEAQKYAPEPDGDMEAHTVMVFVVDSSGSMWGRRNEVLKTVNELFEKTRDDDVDDVVMYMITKFDTSVRPVRKLQDVAGFETFTEMEYAPGGGTALYDAVGVSIRDVHSMLAKFKNKPNVLFTVITDGGENSSVEFRNNASAIREMVTEREKDGWTFTFMGSSPETWKDSKSMGFDGTKAMKYKNADMGSVGNVLYNATSSLRGMRMSRGMSAAPVIAQSLAEVAPEAFDEIDVEYDVETVTV